MPIPRMHPGRRRNTHGGIVQNTIMRGTEGIVAKRRTGGQRQAGENGRRPKSNHPCASREAQHNLRRKATQVLPQRLSLGIYSIKERLAPST
jgi:hypothetical protein